ncbi:hypothetical protein B0H14DRAFT_2625095 [Mycena olivaceomarginata]|nr:hypothetical protein B0H14DRAFT_2625095 [Mycena olivaceomarginata]
MAVLKAVHRALSHLLFARCARMPSRASEGPTAMRRSVTGTDDIGLATMVSITTDNSSVGRTFPLENATTPMAPFFRVAFLSLIVAPFSFDLARAVTTAVNFASSKWIWTPTTTTNAFFALRKRFPPPLGKSLVAAEIIITADNQSNFYVNGDFVGSGSATSTASVIVKVEINMVPSGRASCTAGALLLTDAEWKSTKGTIPTGFEQPGFDDSAWPVVVAEETYVAGPTWGTLTIAAVSPPVTI